MGIDRIIFLLVIIRVVENQAAPYISGGSTCGGSKWNYLFVLNPTANEINLLTDLVESARSAVVKRPAIDGDPVEVVVSSQDFTEFIKKSQVLKIYRSHSLQCVDPTRNLPIVERNSSGSSSEWTELSGTAKENPSINITIRSAPKMTKKFDEKMRKNLDDCKTKFSKKLMKLSSLNNVEKSLKATAPLSTILVGSSTSRISRASKTTAERPKKGTTKQKSKENPDSKLSKGKIYGKSKEQKKSAINNVTKSDKSVRKKTKANVTNKKTTLIPVRTTTTEGPWNRLMSMAAKSLTKSNSSDEMKSSSIAREKLLPSVKVGNVKEAIATKKNSSKRAKNTRKSFAKTSASVTNKTKSSSSRNRASDERKSISKLEGRKKLFSALNPTIRKPTVVKNRKGNRDSRELKVFAEIGTKCSENNSRTMKRWVEHYVKRDITFHAPIACTVIKISNSCDYDCSEDNEAVVENTTEKNSSKVPESSPPSEQEESMPEPKPQPDLVPVESPEDVHEESPAERPIEPSGEQPDELIDPEYREPVIDPSEMDGYEEISENYEDDRQSEMLEKPVGKVLPGDLKHGPVDYQELPDPSFGEDSIAITPIFHSDEMPEYPMISENPHQSLGHGLWFTPSPPTPQFASTTSSSRPSQTLERPVIPENTLRIPLGFVNKWPRPPDMSLKVPEVFEEEIEDADYDEDDYEEHDEEFEGDKQENGLEVSPLPASFQPQINSQDKFKEFSLKKNEIDDGKDLEVEEDYDDEDYDAKDEDYDEDDDNHEDYVEESGNTEISDEDDYDLDED